MSQTCALLPQMAPHMRVSALHSAIHASIAAKGDEHRVAACALGMLPTLTAQLRCASDACIPLFDAICSLADACPLQLFEPLSAALGQLACLCARSLKPAGEQTHTTPEGSSGFEFRCQICDASADERRARIRGSSQEGEKSRGFDGSPQPCASGATEGDAKAVQARLSRLIPKLWQMQACLPPDDWSRRTALVDCAARLCMHAHPTQLARLNDVLVQLMALLGDDDDRVRMACSRVLPRLLGSEPVVRAVLQWPEEQPLSSETLRSQMIEPMIEAMCQRRASDPQIMLCMMATLGATCCEELFASDECRASGGLSACSSLSSPICSHHAFPRCLLRFRSISSALSDRSLCSSS